MSPTTVIRRVRRVPVGSVGQVPVDGEPVDVRIVDGTVTEVAQSLAPVAGETVLDGGGRWIVPGLWDQHVHMTQWAQARDRLDVSGTASPEEVLARITPGAGLLIGAGFRPATWARQPTVAELDVVTGDRPTVLVSGDVHTGWLNSAALRRLGLPPREGPVREAEWFALFGRVEDLPEVRVRREEAIRAAVRDAAGRGVVGLVDMEFGSGAYRLWPGRVAAGVDQVRVRTAVYPDRLEDVVDAGLRTGDVLEGQALATMGPLKIISDGSLNARTASCCEPYTDGTHGVQNHSLDQLVGWLSRGHGHGLEVALHAIGDAAVRTALDAFAASGATGGIEHAQLVRFEDLPAMAALGVRASVQPAHLLDDRGVAATCWPGRLDRCYAFRSMVDAGVDVVLGSDAPVSPLDPWLAMAAAVHRGYPDEEPWNPGEGLTAAEALAASVDGAPTVGVGSSGDVVLLDVDPLACTGGSADVARHLRSVPVAATLVAGRPTALSAALGG